MKKKVAILFWQVLGLQALFISSACEQDDWSYAGKDTPVFVQESDSTSQLHYMCDHFTVKIVDAEVWFLSLFLIRSMLLIEVAMTILTW